MMVYIKEYRPDDKEILIAIDGDSFDVLQNAQKIYDKTKLTVNAQEYMAKKSFMSMMLYLINVFIEDLDKEYGGR